MKKTGLLLNITLIINTLIIFLFIILIQTGTLFRNHVNSYVTNIKTNKIILMIGDGMGENAVKLTKDYYQKEYMNMETLPYKGYVKTNSLNLLIPTDSAAAATALATGHKTYNHELGMKGTEVYENISEIAKEKGFGVGIVCTSTLSDATPAAFSVHTSSRSNTEDIIIQQANSNIDLFLGAGYSKYIDYQEEFIQKGYTFINSINHFDINKDKIIGSFSSVGNEIKDEYKPSLSALTILAMRFLEEKYPNGYFLMI